jgi:hypothetical protein
LDYIIFGVGASATLVLVGWLLRDWGPGFRDRKPAEDQVLTASEMVTRMAWARFCATCGMALAICGALVAIATLASFFFAPSDSFASDTVLASFGLSIVLMMAWAWLYLRQFGVLGVLRPKARPEPPPVVEPQPATSPASALATEPAGSPTFAETATARGGLGRFKSFFRREPEPQQPAEAPPVEAASPAVASASSPAAPAAATSSAGESSPTEAVIAELSGEGSGPDSKRLSVDDPLVTDVMGHIAGAATIEQDLLAEFLPPAFAESDPAQGKAPPESPDSSDDLATTGPPHTGLVGHPGDTTHVESSAEAPGSDNPAQDAALENLRKRRLARLAQESDQE